MSDFLTHYLQTTPTEKQSTAAIAYIASIDTISKTSPEIAEAIIKELKDQRSYLKMIASENYSSLETQLTMGNLLTDKYSEGFPHHRFYAGCENIDTIEQQAADLLCEIFGCDHAYVQPHSGADANLVAFWSILIQRIQNPELEKFDGKRLEELSENEYEKIRQLLLNQKLLGMSLDSGGHLTHGYRHNVSSKIFSSYTYGVDKETGLLDYDAIRAQAKEVKPAILLAGYSAYPRRINFAKMRQIADDVGAVLMVDMAHFAGLVAGGVFTGDENPIPFADVVTSTSHKTLRGPRGGFILCRNEYADTINKGCPLILGGPLPHVMAAKAVAFKEAKNQNFRNYSKKVVENAKALAEGLQKRGVPVLTGGTDNHIILFDCRPFNLTGRQVEQALREVGITCNRNAIPFDPNGAWYTSGIRLGTPATTTLGMGISEMESIADVISNLLQSTQATTTKSGASSKAKYEIEETFLAHAKQKIRNILDNFPLYPEITLSSEALLASKD